jgi:hypothetical protein
VFDFHDEELLCVEKKLRENSEELITICEKLIKSDHSNSGIICIYTIYS